MKFSAPRGFTLIELIVGQVIVGIIAAGVFSLIAAQTQSFHSTWATTEAQVRLRESTHLLLRDVQGLGDVSDGAGEVIGFIDGGSGAADALMSYRTDISLCSAAVSGVHGASSEDITLDDVSGSCPIGTLPGCTIAELVGRTILVRPVGTPGQDAGFFVITAANSGSCSVTLGTASNGNHLDIYDAIHRNATATASVSDALDIIRDSSGAVGLAYGTSMYFAVDASTEHLRRSVNGGALANVVEGIHDLQVQTAHDIDGDGAIANGEWDQTGALASADLNNFVAMKIGLMAFASSKRGLEVAAPAAFGNRDHTGAPTGRRYRQSFVVAAGRN